MRSQQPPPRWTTGFWLWSDRSEGAPAADVMLDVLFLHAGTIHKPDFARDRWSVYGDLPRELPPARDYWVVFRFERQSVPDMEAAPLLARQVLLLLETAHQRHLNLVGVQLDIDSPTAKLSQYASFLQEVRKGLPAGTEISITALLDWFRDGTAIADVIRQVDEFVPQFYDLGGENYLGETAVAARIEPTKWAAKFNRFGKRFRIGISTFGRARIIPAVKPVQTGYPSFGYRDLKPLDIAIRPAFNLATARNEANELVLSYKANRATRIGYKGIERGDTFQFTLPTPETVRAAVESAKNMGGYAAGVLFFRLPDSDENLVMEPNEVLIAAGVAPGAQRKPAGIHLVDGGCAAVSCVDLYLVNASPFDPNPVHYKVRISTELEYFLPEEGMPVKMSGPSQLELSLPPYCGRGRMYLGRAVTTSRAEYTIEVGR